MGQFKTALLLACFLLTVATVPAVAQETEAESAEAEPLVDPDEHCVIFYQETGEVDSEGYQKTTPDRRGCYATFAQAIYVATDGEVRLPAAYVASEVNDDTFDVASTRNVIGIDYAQVEQRGSTLTHVARRRCGAPDAKGNSVKYAASSMASGWNDRVSSAKGYGGCNRFSHFQHEGYGGAERVCSPGCQHMGVMNNQTSSEKWRHAG